MDRHGYIDDFSHDPLELGRWRGQVLSAIRGKRGQAFLRELAEAMDAMPVKELITHNLVDDFGCCCTMGVVCQARGIDVSKIDPEDTEAVGKALGIARQMVAEIAFENDDDWYGRKETPAERWQRMRKWVNKHLKKEKDGTNLQPA